MNINENINVGNLVRIDLGFWRVDNSLECERKYAWALVKEIIGVQQRFVVHFVEDGREHIYKRHEIKTVVNENGQIMSSTK